MMLCHAATGSGFGFAVPGCQMPASDPDFIAERHISSKFERT